MPGKQLVGQSRFVFAVFISKKRAVEPGTAYPAGSLPAGVRVPSGALPGCRLCCVRAPRPGNGAARACAGLQRLAAHPAAGSCRRIRKRWGILSAAAGSTLGAGFCRRFFSAWQSCRARACAGLSCTGCPGRGRQAVMNWVAAVRAGAARGLPAAAAAERRPPGRGLPERGVLDAHDGQGCATHSGPMTCPTRCRASSRLMAWSTPMARAMSRSSRNSLCAGCSGLWPGPAGRIRQWRPAGAAAG